MNYILSCILFLSIADCIQSFTFPSSSQKINDNLTFYWEFLSNDTLMMAIDHRCNETGWVGLGMGGFGMEKVDMMSIEFSYGDAVIYDRYSYGYGPPQLDTVLGGYNDYVIVDKLWDPYTGRWYYKYYRVVDTMDPLYDIVLYPRYGFQMSWAYGSTPTMQYHGANRGIIEFDLIRPGDDDNGNSQNGRRTALGLWSELIMLIAWGFLIDVPLILAHCLKTKKKVIAVHKVTSIISDLIGTGAALSQFIISFKLNKSNQGSQPTPHNWLGLLIGLLGAFQLLEGTLLCLQDSRQVTSKRRNIHQWLGYVLYITAKIYIAIGVASHQNKWIYALIVAYCLLATNHIVVMFVRTGWKKEIRRKEETKTTIEQPLVESQRQF